MKFNKPRKETVLLELRNEQRDVMKLWMDPWCEEFELPEGVSWRLTAVGKIRGSQMVSVAFQEDGLVIWGIPEVVMCAYLNAEMIWECFMPFRMPS